MDEPAPPDEQEQAREYAISRLKAKRDFVSLLGSALVVSVIVTLVWALGGQGSFWPIWVMLGFGIALLFSGWRAYGPRQGPITEEEIQREMDK